MEERCNFLQEVNEHLKGILDSVTVVATQIRQQDAGQEGETPFANGSETASNSDAQVITDAVDQFRAAVFAVSDLCHAQIDKTPAPSRISRAPYILELAYENIKEAASIETRYAALEDPE
eukprot:Protomagalhaensia_sp_Gyna_25__1064@NODE_1516_length_1768_cov_30_459803_g1230_i0_p3_GENE_NODE_1516_length_1768_cov_30_459803_g1230_i0NODE_1516_length_1768_cov_30_459803_g1230_i0_p3_ORF_typecomplete_len120_score17_91_NODE_1516_length_1768_cov_30_459803_g1230_i0275634